MGAPRGGNYLGRQPPERGALEVMRQGAWGSALQEGSSCIAARAIHRLGNALTACCAETLRIQDFGRADCSVSIGGLGLRKHRGYEA